MLPKQSPFPLPTHLLFLILFLHFSLFPSQKVCNHQDKSALLAFSLNTAPSSPSLSLNWSSSTSCCRWEGVKCDTNGRVTHLQLPSRGLNGVITSSISNLVMLTHLNLSNNYLHGPIGEDFNRLTHLRILDLSQNRFLGSIPREIGNLLYLEKLHLYENNLSGSIPLSLMSCENLVEIFLRDNLLNGDISKLDFSRLVRLQKLDLRNNSLNGTLPESIYSCKSLIAIGLALNSINGQISPKIVELKSLSFIALSRNSLTNITLTLRVLAKCESLTSVLLSSNFYGESLPIHTNFIGLGEFPKLQFFFLDNCEFAPGPIPNWLSSLKRLRILSLRRNGMTGRLPNWLGNLPSLFRLQLNNNSLFGELPLKLCQLPALISQNVQLDLELFPIEIKNIYSGFGGNPYIWSKDNFYHGLDLSDNAFNGDIPEEIGNLRNLQQLDLSSNNFSGHIPRGLSNLKVLEKLNFSKNNLIGEISTSLVSLTFLSKFDVSYNDLEGPIPTGGQFSTFPNSSFEGNLGLCGEPLNHWCSNIPATSRTIDGNLDTRHHFLDGLFVGFASGFSSILLFVAYYAWFNNCKKRQRHPRD